MQYSMELKTVSSRGEIKGKKSSLGNSTTLVISKAFSFVTMWKNLVKTLLGLKDIETTNRTLFVFNWQAVVETE